MPEDVRSGVELSAPSVSFFAAPRSRGELEDLLACEGASTGLWGSGEAKSLEHLLAELAAGECRLGRDQDGRLVRCVRGAQLRIRHRSFTLVEACQVFADGRERHRDLQASCEEKLTAGEDPAAGALRCLKDRLGVSWEPELGEPAALHKRARSQPYPGLRSVFQAFTWDAELPEAHCRPDGYEERQSGKTTFWEWVPTAEAPF